jgi:hypothetical protein
VERNKTSEADISGQEPAAPVSPEEAAENGKHRKNGGWQEIEARREKAALKASLADVWDEDFDLDEEILADLDHTAEFFTPQNDAEEEDFDEEDGADEFFDDDPV